MLEDLQFFRAFARGRTVHLCILIFRFSLLSYFFMKVFDFALTCVRVVCSRLETLETPNLYRPELQWEMLAPGKFPSEVPPLIQKARLPATNTDLLTSCKRQTHIYADLNLRVKTHQF